MTDPVDCEHETLTEETFTCERCGFVGNRHDPIHDIPIAGEYDGDLLCASCRVTRRMEDGDFNG